MSICMCVLDSDHNNMSIRQYVYTMSICIDSVNTDILRDEHIYKKRLLVINIHCV